MAETPSTTAYWQPGGKLRLFLHRALPDGTRIEVRTGRRAPVNFTVCLEPPKVYVGDTSERPSRTDDKSVG